MAFTRLPWRVDFPDWSGSRLVRRAPHGIAGRERYDVGEIQDDTAQG